MIIYTLFLILIYLSFSIKKTKVIRGIYFHGIELAFFFTFLFSAFRFDVGYDYSMYYHLIKGDIKFIEDQLNRLEFLSRIIVDFSHYTGFIQLFFITYSFLTLLLFYKTIKRFSSSDKVSTLIFVCIPIFFFQSLTLVRQYAAIAIIFYSFRFIKRRQFLYFLTALGVASLFHRSAFIAFPIYFLYGNFYADKKIIVGIYILGFFSSSLIAFLVELISERYTAYLERIAGEGGSLLLLFFQIIGLLLLPIVYSIHKKENKEFNFYLLCFYIGLFIWSSLSKYGHAGIRGGLYFMSFIILLIPDLMNKIKQRGLVKLVVLAICFVFFFFNLYIGTQHKIKDPNLPYQVFFFKTSKDLKPDEENK